MDKKLKTKSVCPVCLKVVDAEYMEKNNLEKEPKNWVIDADDTGVTFKPLKVHHYAANNLLKYGDVVIFMSATILSHKMFSKWLGLNPNEVYHIKVDSPFSKEKRPIILQAKKEPW